MGKNNACLPNLEPLFAAGINPKTGLPVKFGGSKKALKEDIKKFLRVVDEQDACNRFIWENLPANITNQELERMIYYKGQLCLFYDETLDEYFISPYALDGTVDIYGRYNTIHPVPMTSGTEDKGNKAVAEYFAEKKLKVIYKPEQLKEDENKNNCAVLIHDYTKQLSQTIIPRAAVNDPLLDVMAECIPFMRTNLLLSTGVTGIRVQDADQAINAKDASRSMESAALTGEAYMPIIGNVDFQELNNSNVGKSEEYMLAMQSLDNLRLAGHGIPNGGLFEKKSHELQSEADINGGPIGLVMQDGLAIRENFCEIANSLWGLQISVKPSENVDGSQITNEDNGDSHVIYESSESMNNNSEGE